MNKLVNNGCYKNLHIHWFKKLFLPWRKEVILCLKFSLSIRNCNMRFMVHTVVNTKIAVFRSVVTCTPVDCNQYFWENYNFHLQGTRTEFFSESSAPTGLLVSPLQLPFPIMYHFPVWFISTIHNNKVGNDGNNLRGYSVSPPWTPCIHENTVSNFSTEVRLFFQVEESSIFYLEEGGNVFLWNLIACLPDNKVPKPTRPQCKSLSQIIWMSTKKGDGRYKIQEAEGNKLMMQKSRASTLLIWEEVKYAYKN